MQVDPMDVPLPTPSTASASTPDYPMLPPPGALAIAHRSPSPRTLAQAHVAYIAVLVGRTHVQYSRTPWKKQRGPSLHSKCIYSYGPITKCCICSRMGQLYAVAFKIFACIGPSRA
jgi:hypothetical protein